MENNFPIRFLQVDFYGNRGYDEVQLLATGNVRHNLVADL